MQSNSNEEHIQNCISGFPIHPVYPAFTHSRTRSHWTRSFANMTVVCWTLSFVKHYCIKIAVGPESLWLPFVDAARGCLPLWLCRYAGVWLCSYVAMWLYGDVALCQFETAIQIFKVSEFNNAEFQLPKTRRCGDTHFHNCQDLRFSYLQKYNVFEK